MEYLFLVCEISVKITLIYHIKFVVNILKHFCAIYTFFLSSLACITISSRTQPCYRLNQEHHDFHIVIILMINLSCEKSCIFTLFGMSTSDMQDESEDFIKRQQLRELALLNSNLREESPGPSGSVSPFNSSGMKRAKTGR